MDEGTYNLLDALRLKVEELETKVLLLEAALAAAEEDKPAARRIRMVVVEERSE